MIILNKILKFNFKVTLIYRVYKFISGAKKRNRQLLKEKNAASSTTTSSTENNNISNLLNDSADDEMMMLCSQAIEKSIATDNYNHTVGSNTSSKSHFSSIVGISPLKNTNSTSANMLSLSTKKFKPSHCELGIKANENNRSQFSTITSSTENKLPTNANNCSSSASSTVTNSYKDFSSSLNDSLASDDDLFSALDLSAIEKQVMTETKNTTSVSLKCDTHFNKQQPNTKISNKIENKTGMFNNKGNI